MSIRRDPIYISSDVYRWLRLLAKAETDSTERAGGIEMGKIVTVDQIADHILRQAIREQHPQLSEHEKQIDKLEKQLIESLRNENTTVPRTSDTGHKA